MLEHDARQVVWVRWIETTDTDRQLLLDEAREQASRSARELMQPTAGCAHGAPRAEEFLKHRAGLILRMVANRFPQAAALLQQSDLARLAWASGPAIAFVAGVGADRIGDPHRVDLLSVPLLLIICWNLAVYLAMLGCRLVRLPKVSWTGLALFLRPGTRAPNLPGTASAILAVAALAFANDWARLTQRLFMARIGRTLHLGAALFAVGAALSLYLRGFFSEYRAGWESTFLNGPEVAAILSFLFAPAHAIFGIGNFSVAEVEALRFSPGGPLVSSGAGARWVYLYAATLLLVVILPRLLLALAAQRRAMRLARSFRLPLQLPYYRKLTVGLDDRRRTLHVLPYSFTLDAPRRAGLAMVAIMMLGENAGLVVRPVAHYGADPDEADLTAGAGAGAGPDGAAPNEGGGSLMAVLFNLAATPEMENHGAFLRAWVARSPDVMVLIDESGFLERQTPDGGGGRLAQRIALWKGFCDAQGASATIVNLHNPTTRRHDVESAAVP